jgi:hypothetical protein
MENNVPIRFYWARNVRYWTRQAKAIQKIVQSFSIQTFTDLLGHTGESLFDQAIPWGGFLPIARDARSYQGKVWTKTEDIWTESMKKMELVMAQK